MLLERALANRNLLESLGGMLRVDLADTKGWYEVYFHQLGRGLQKEVIFGEEKAARAFRDGLADPNADHVDRRHPVQLFKATIVRKELK